MATLSPTIPSTISSFPPYERVHLRMFGMSYSVFSTLSVLLYLFLGTCARTLGNDPFELPIKGDGSIPPPELIACHNSMLLPSGAKLNNCCPPIPGNSSKMITFKEHLKTTDNTKLRVRKPVHEVAKDPEYVRKLERAIQALKDLPESDPRSFKQQGNVHCTYCSGAYPQIPWSSSAADNPLQIHYGWLFFPFHRWYLYFFEKIVGKMIGDPSFTLPFWNWDHPDGMHMPRIFTDNVTSSLFHKFRNPGHYAPTIADLNFDVKAGDNVSHQSIKYNLHIMHRQMIHANTPELFMGQCYRAGNSWSRLGGGSVENVPHNTLHSWIGDPGSPNHEDMGAFYSAAFDPIFYTHHSNIDRLWSVWKTLPGKFRKYFTSKDWLDSGFTFYDENSNVVKVTIRDCLDTKNLGYVYKDVENLWVSEDFKPKPRLALKTSNAKFPAAPTIEETKFPLVLDSTKKFYVTRPEPKPKANENLVLVIEDIEFGSNVEMKFDVFLNDEGENSCTPENTEFVGSFASIPSSRVGETKNSSLKINISDMLVDLQVSDDDSAVLVTLVPRSGLGKVSIGGIKIKLEKITTESICQ
ncbi:hypothetical protein L6164_032813 [Bauhinia variegata]|uniref:Uncharacterized protein n=1 Tax=Bauhinia variegata TaxID=167791 RepID=A0ACB9KQH6_BAUVA|nr:hypothetical protein L6164_032813 [Bauhinia variegata]